VNNSRKLWSRQARNVAPPEIKNYTSEGVRRGKEPFHFTDFGALFIPPDVSVAGKHVCNCMQG